MKKYHKKKNYKLNKAELFDILDRIIRFIHGCDNKASIILAIIGIILTIFFTSGGIDSITKIITFSLSSLPPYLNIACCLFFTLTIITASILLTYGLISILLVLYAKTDIKEYGQDGIKMDSVIFFGTIANNKYLEYKGKLLNIIDKNYVNDIVSEIYINSIICQEKYRNYKKGMKFSLFGLATFIAVLILGNLLFWITKVPE